MKKLLAALACALTFWACAPRQAHIDFPETKSIAQHFYIPLGCQDFLGNVQIMGTGFPVASDLIMTAAHVYCYPDVGNNVYSPDGGRSWFTIGPQQRFENGAYDVAVIITTPNLFADWAHFRAPVLGETVIGFGSAYGDLGILSQGFITSVGRSGMGPRYFRFSNVPIGGMSGSVVLGVDNMAVGIVNHGWPDSRVGGSLSGGLTGDLLQELLDKFLAWRADAAL